MRSPKNRIVIEDALKYFHECEYEGNCTLVTPEGVAGMLGLSRDEAVDLLEEMSQARWIQAGASGQRLTEYGRIYARQVIRTHRLVETYLARSSSVSSGEWHHQADRIEHRMDLEAAERLAHELGNPRFDPHGDPIPTSDGELPVLDRKPLSDFESGAVLEIVHVGDEPEGIGLKLAAYALSPGQLLKITSQDENNLTLQVEGRNLMLSRIEASLLQVKASDQELMDVVPLSRLTLGQHGVLTGLSPSCHGAQRNRLLDLGFVSGSSIEVENISPLGSPTAYRIRGTLIALRPSQADWVLLDGATIS